MRRLMVDTLGYLYDIGILCNFSLECEPNKDIDEVIFVCQLVEGQLL